MKKLKQAFTVIELVIVIAVIAILAAVMIPTFSSIVEKANYSADEQIAASLNTILKIYDGEINSENDLRKAIDENCGDGYFDNLTAQSSKYGYQFWYDIEEKKILINKYDDLSSTTDESEQLKTLSLKNNSIVLPISNENENNSLFLSLYTINKDNKKYLLLGAKNGYGEFNKLMNELELVNSSESYSNLITELSKNQNTNDLYMQIFENLKDIAILNDCGLFAYSNGIQNIYIPSSTTLLGSKKNIYSDNNNGLTFETKYIEIPKGTKIGTDSLKWLDGTSIYIDIEEEELGDYINADAINENIIVLPNGDKYIQKNGTEFYKIKDDSTEEKIENVKSEYTIKMDSFEVKANASSSNKVNLYFSESNSKLYIADDYKDTIKLQACNFKGTNNQSESLDLEPSKIFINNTEVTKDNNYSYNLTTWNDNMTINVTAQDKTYKIQIIIVKVTSIDITLLDGNKVSTEGSESCYIPVLNLSYSLNKTSWSLPITKTTNYGYVTLNQDITITDENGYLTYDNGYLVLTDEGKSLVGDVEAYYITVKCGDAERKCKVTLIDNKTPAFTIKNNVYNLTKYENLTFTFGTTGGVTSIKLVDLFKGDSNVISGQNVTFTNSATGSVTLSASEWENYEIDLSKVSSDGQCTFTISCRGKSLDVTINIVKGAYNVASKSDWKNAPNSTDIVLLKDITIPDTTYTALNSGTGYYSKNIGNKTIYGNLHTIKFGTYLIKVEKQNSYFIKGSGCTLTDLLIEGPKYDKAAYGYSSTNAKNGYYVFGAYLSGENTITNCYISGFNSSFYIASGTQNISSTVLKGGALANIYIHGSNVILNMKNVTTIQYEETNVALGAGIFINNTAKDVIINADGLKQYNFYTETQIKNIGKTLVTWPTNVVIEGMSFDNFKDIKTDNGYHISIFVWHESNNDGAGISTNTINGYCKASISNKVKSYRGIDAYGAGPNMPIDTITSYSSEDFLKTQN